MSDHPTDSPSADDSPTDAPTIEVDVWADLICPWCYLGGHRLATAVAASGRSDRVRLRLRSFELDPSADHEPMSVAESFASKRGVPREQFEQMEGGVRDMAHGEGLEYTMERPVSNTFDVHRVVQLANETGAGWELFTRLQEEYFAGRLDPFDRRQLVAAAVEAGLDADEVEAVLDGDRFAAEVRADEALARQLGVTGVPFVVFDGRLAAPGALSPDQYGAALADVTD